MVPGVAESVERAFRAIFQTGEPLTEFEVSGETPKQPGVKRTWLENVGPVINDVGEVSHILVTVQEITHLKAAEETKNLLMREVDHRAKNILAVVQSLLNLTTARPTRH